MAKALFLDYGLNLELAATLKREFKSVYYWAPWKSAFSSYRELKIGKNFDGIERIEDWEDYKDKVDVIVVPDSGFGSVVNDLKKQGYKVWGTDKAEILEFDRWKMRKLQKIVGLPTQKTIRIKGLDDLILFFKGIRRVVKEMCGEYHNEFEKSILKNIWKKYEGFSENYLIGDEVKKSEVIKEWLEGGEEKYVKSTYRGTIETFYVKNYDDALSKFNQLSKEYGHSSSGEDIEFIVEERIEGIEPGGDHIQIGGEFLSPTMWGWEVKGMGYVGKRCDWKEMPKPIREISEKLGLLVKKISPLSANFLSTELILSKNGKSYLIDPCPRMALPTVGAIQTEFITNLGEIILWGAKGKIVKPKFLPYKYCAAISCESEWAQDHELEITFKCPRNRIKFRKAYKTKEGVYTAVEGFTSICSIIGFGNTVEEAIKEVKKNAEGVSAYELQVLPDELNKIIEEIKKAKREYGIDF